MAVASGHRDAASADDALNAGRDATEPGMARDDFHSVPEWDAMAVFVPLGQRESAAAYGLRAAGEILVRYLMDDA